MTNKVGARKTWFYSTHFLILLNFYKIGLTLQTSDSF